MRIGILQTGQAPEPLRKRAGLGDYPDLFVRLLAGHGFDFRTWHVEAMEFPSSIHDVEGWLITGSRHGVYEDHAFIPPLEQLIRKAMAAGVPVAGICFGHQIMARAMGGRVEKWPGGWAVGPQDYDFGGSPVRLNAWHQDQVISPPPGAEVAATNPFCPHAALRYGAHGFSLQAHPEFDDAFIAGLIETRGRGVVPEDRIAAAEAGRGSPSDAARVADMIADLFLSARQGVTP
jgi:GMP synthase-like glutamine amidotransferase